MRLLLETGKEFENGLRQTLGLAAAGKDPHHPGYEAQIAAGIVNFLRPQAFHAVDLVEPAPDSDDLLQADRLAVVQFK